RRVQVVLVLKLLLPVLLFKQLPVLTVVQEVKYLQVVQVVQAVLMQASQVMRNQSVGPRSAMD
ncbi:MAG: hypothetical protein ACON3Z_18675, partial [Bradymonadia bacterium]